MRLSALRSCKVLGAAGVSCILVLLFLLMTVCAPPVSLRAGGRASAPVGYAGVPRPRDYNGRADTLAREEQLDAAWDIPEELDPVGFLPLALKGYYRLPPWSGDARFGFGVSDRPVEQYDVSLLHADWYLRFGFRADPPLLGSLEFAQTVRLSESGYSPDQATIVRYAMAQPGTLWLIGNEPDAPAQDCVTPARYAELYHELYQIIRGADPSAKIAIGGVVQATPLRLQYLDMILQEYEARYGGMMPVDVWNVHGFILQEKAHSWGCQIPCGIEGVEEGILYPIQDHDNMAIFQEQIVRFRQWMADHGERNKPLIVSEYGILFPIQLGFDEPRVEEFMLSTFDYFLNATSGSLGYPEDGNRLVQAWCWYSLDDDSFEGYESYSHLFDPDTRQITPLGMAYADYTASLP